MTATFCGHREVSQSEKLEKWLNETIGSVVAYVLHDWGRAVSPLLHVAEDS